MGDKINIRIKILVGIILAAVSIFWCINKQGMFIDEIFTIGLSNSYYAPFISDIVGDNSTGGLISRQDILDYLEVSSQDRFAVSSVFYNQSRDVHPPLHYLIYNFVSSFFLNSHSKWIGLGINLLMYFIITSLLFVLTKKMVTDERLAMLAVLLYSFSQTGLSTMLMIRMYALLTMFTLLLALLVYKFIKGRRSMLVYIGIGVTTCLGMLTQYYFIFYAFFLCLAVLCWTLFKEKKAKEAILFSLSSAMGIVTMVAIFPSVINHMFSHKLVSGTTVASNMMSIKIMFINFAKFSKQFLLDDWCIALTAVILLIVLFYVLKKNEGHLYVPVEWILIVFPAIVTLLLVFLISPAISLRYVYNIMPLIVLMIPCLVSLIENRKGFSYEKILSIVVLGLCFVNIIYPFIRKPAHLHQEQVEYSAIMCKYKNSPCLYFDPTSGGAVTWDLLLVSNLTDVFVNKIGQLTGKVEEYIKRKNGEELIVFVKSDNFWGRGFLPDDILNEISSKTEYGTPQLLFSNGLSQTYLLKKQETR